MQTLLFFERDDAPPTARDELEQALAMPGVELGGEPGAAYRAGVWRDPDTGAWCHLDVGESPLEADEMHPATRYPGWREVPLTVQIPLSGAHWRCVEALTFVDRLLARLPEVMPLDTEDTRADPDRDAGPFALARPRALASWERLHAAHHATRPTPRMDRTASLALWRYRRERGAGRAAHPRLIWPDALVLADGDAARSACLWADPALPMALPPVELVVVQRGDGPGVLPADEVATAGSVQPLQHGLAAVLSADARLDDLFRRARLMPTTRFRALDDDDWSD
ncbi:MAG TPA: hypothetical protein VEL07_10630 [Planctomycetota bacterium]|nr:hypothetical protein [Planctomycetota bacterium]